MLGNRAWMRNHRFEHKQQKTNPRKCWKCNWIIHVPTTRLTTKSPKTQHAHIKMDSSNKWSIIHMASHNILPWVEGPSCSFTKLAKKKNLNMNHWQQFAPPIVYTKTPRGKKETSPLGLLKTKKYSS